jgi:hypothetical protein
LGAAALLAGLAVALVASFFFPGSLWLTALAAVGAAAVVIGSQALVWLQSRNGPIE